MATLKYTACLVKSCIPFGATEMKLYMKCSETTPQDYAMIRREQILTHKNAIHTLVEKRNSQSAVVSQKYYIC